MSTLKKVKEYTILLCQNLLVAALYIVAAKAGLSLAGYIEQVTLVWPPTGLALVALLLLGFRVTPGILIGAFIANILTKETFPIATGIAIGNTLEAVTGMYLLKKNGFSPAFERVRDVLLLVIYAAFFSTMVSATIGVSSLIYGGIGGWDRFGSIWATWWLGDLMGNMVVAPLLLVWLHTRWNKLNPRRLLEGLGLLASIVLVSLIVFRPFGPDRFMGYPLEYLLFPVIAVVAFRFKQHGTTLATLIISVIAISATISGHGPFMSPGNPQQGLFFLQFFMGITALTSLILAAVIKEREAAETKVEHNEKRFRALIENSSDVISLIDNAATVFYTSPSTQKVLGYSVKEFVGTNVFQYIYPEDRERIMGLFKDILKTPGKVISTEYRTLRKDASWRWMEGTGTNLLHEPGVHGIVINYRDIHERKKLDQAKSDFVTLAAHQLRTPLTTMQWYAEALLDLTKKQADKTSDYVRELYLGTTKLKDFTNTLLNISRLELGTLKTEVSKINLQEIVTSVLEELAPQIKQEKLLVVQKVPKTLPVLIADSKLTRIMVHNLLTNAVLYTPDKGKITVEITSFPEEITLAVKDTGIGIPADDQEKIFTKLFRAANVKKMVPDGTGLGLYLVKTLVEGQGGKIWFTSTENKGTTFFLSLPTKHAETTK